MPEHFLGIQLNFGNFMKKRSVMEFMIENKDIDKRMKKIDENLDVLNEIKKEVVSLID